MIYTTQLQKYQLVGKDYEKKIAKYDKTKITSKSEFSPIGMVFKDISGAYFREYLEALILEKGYSHY